MPGADASSQQAFLVSTENEGEHDVLARFFCRRAGAQLVKARGLRKQSSKLGGRLKQADELELRLSGRGRVPTLTGVTIIFDHGWWRADLDRLALVWLMHECAFESSSDEQSNAGVYRLIANIQRSRPEDKLLHSAATTFCLKLLKLLGLQPELDHCSIDGHELVAGEPVHLIPSCEGLAGREGYNRKYSSANSQTNRISSGDLADWRRFQDAPLSECLKLESTQTGTALALHCLQVLLTDAGGRQIRAVEFLTRQWKLPDVAELNQP